VGSRRAPLPSIELLREAGHPEDEIERYVLIDQRTVSALTAEDEAWLRQQIEER
jgi:hypothetical protein